MATWDTTFETSPANGDNPSAGAGKIRELKVEVGDRGNREHTWAGTTAADGIHRAGSAKVYFTTATPTLQPDGVTALTTTDKGRLYYKSSTGSGILVYNGTGFVSTGVTLSTSQTIRGVKTFTSLAGNVPSLKKFSTSGTSTTSGLKVAVFSIGSWNMDATASVNVSTGIDYSRWRHVDVIINGDNANFPTAPLLWNYTSITGGYWNCTPVNKATRIVITRNEGGYFDTVNYNDTSVNRGWVTVIYSV